MQSAKCTQPPDFQNPSAVAVVPSVYTVGREFAQSHQAEE